MHDKDFSDLAAQAGDNQMALQAYEVEATQRAAAAIERVRPLILPDSKGPKDAA